MPTLRTSPARAHRCAAAALALLAVGAGAAAAATKVELKQGGGRFDAFSGVAVDGDRADNRIAVGFEVETNRYVIRDRASRVVGRECEQVSRHAIRCEAAFQGELRVRGNEGDDILELSRQMHRSGILIGGSGQDELRGGPRNDFVNGGGAGDVLIGRSGDDSLDGFGGADVLRGGGGGDLLGAVRESGRDIYLGGGGDDLITSADDDADRRIDCGPGPDQAFVDPQDPRAERCERVRTIRD